MQLGDLLCAVPALRALRRALPHAEITLIGLLWARTLVDRYRAYLDSFLDFPGHPGMPEAPAQPDRMPAFLARAQQHRFDLVIQMHGSGGITNPLVALLGARHIAGYHVPGSTALTPSGSCHTRPESRRSGFICA